MSYATTYDRDRVAGLQIAKQLNAPKTAAAIEDPSQCFEDIFNVALAEVGCEQLAAVLAEASPIWAHRALLAIPDLGTKYPELLKHAAEAPDGSITPGATTARPAPLDAMQPMALSAGLMGGPLSSMRLNNHMAADCQWTIEWFDGAIQPLKTYPDWNTWTWSGTLTAGKGSEMSVVEVAQKVPNAPLKDGDVVWVYVWVAGGSDKSGKDNLTSFQFTYVSGSPLKATFGISGTTTINSLSVESYPSS